MQMLEAGNTLPHARGQITGKAQQHGCLIGPVRLLTDVNDRNLDTGPGPAKQIRHIRHSAGGSARARLGFMCTCGFGKVVWLGHWWGLVL